MVRNRRGIGQWQFAGKGGFPARRGGLPARGQQLELETICLDVNAPAVYEGYHSRWGRGADSSAAWQLESR